MTSVQTCINFSIRKTRSQNQSKPKSYEENTEPLIRKTRSSSRKTRVEERTASKTREASPGVPLFIWDGCPSTPPKSCRSHKKLVGSSSNSTPDRSVAKNNINNASLLNTPKKRVLDDKGLVKKCVCSPPKQKKEESWRSSVTPQRSVLRETNNSETLPNTHPYSENIQSPLTSPSSLITRISLKTPRSKVEDTEHGNKSPKKTFTPVSLFRPDVSSYQKIRQVLHTSVPETLICREQQIKGMNEFMEKHLSEKKPGSLYISGAPGTGKTACVEQILKTLKMKSNFKYCFVNCMSLQTTAAVYCRIAKEMDVKFGGKNEQEAVKFLVKRITSSAPMLLLVLDEIDQLDSKNQDILYTIFEWPSLFNSKLILVGIANALDLTDRILPRLQARPSCRPQLMHFPPYTKHQIVQIINERLKEVKTQEKPIIQPGAIQFLAGKVAAVTGDVRKALDVCRRAVEMVERDAKRQQVLRPTSDDCLNSGNPRKSPRKRCPMGTSMKMVDLPLVMKIMNDIYGSKVMAGMKNNTQCIPLQQKILICTLLLLLKSENNKEVTLGKLHETYCLVCKKRSVTDVDQSEFLSLCRLVESKGIISLRSYKEMRFSKVTLRLDEREVESALQDKNLLAAIVNDKSCLSS